MQQWITTYHIIIWMWNILSFFMGKNCKEPNSLQRIKSWHDLLYLCKIDKHRTSVEVVLCFCFMHLLDAAVNSRRQQKCPRQQKTNVEGQIRCKCLCAEALHFIFETGHISYFPLTPLSIPLPASPFPTHALRLSFPQPPASYPSNPDTPCAASPQIPLQS